MPRSENDVLEELTVHFSLLTIQKIKKMSYIHAKDEVDYWQATHSFLEGFLAAADIYNAAITENNKKFPKRF